MKDSTDSTDSYMFNKLLASSMGFFQKSPVYIEDANNIIRLKSTFNDFFELLLNVTTSGNSRLNSADWFNIY